MSIAPSAAPATPPIPDDDPYFGWVRRFPLRPIRSDAHLSQAIEVIRDLCAREVLSDSEEEYQDVLGTLIGIYEAEHVPMPDVPGHEMLRYLIESRGLSQLAVAQAAGIPPTSLNEMVVGKRRIGPAALRKLGDYFEISPAVFL